MDGTEATRADQRPAPSAMADSSLKLDRPPAAGSLAPGVSHKDKGASYAVEPGDPRPADLPMAAQLGGPPCGVERSMRTRSPPTAIWGILQNGGARPGLARGRG
uniref:Uncharacterized protein n=1 Tax=Rangifer tarandus platyrhynchus TaxID=3082113 RepID=A0ACB0EXC5_RANTA|nr:unnamed protein product [Rangifer tarandus platyrhynchus]